MSKKQKPNYLPYPKPDAIDSGMKVGWKYYKDKAAANTAAEAAKHNAKIQEVLGYDFGYQAPGSVTQCNENYKPQFAGMYEVCIP